MFKKLYKRIVVWRHRNAYVVWQVRKNGMVPGLDCPWESGDAFELCSPSSGNFIGYGKIDEELAEKLNEGFCWFKTYKSS